MQISNMQIRNMGLQIALYTNFKPFTAFYGYFCLLQEHCGRHLQTLQIYKNSQQNEDIVTKAYIRKNSCTFGCNKIIFLNAYTFGKVLVYDRTFCSKMGYHNCQSTGKHLKKLSDFYCFSWNLFNLALCK